MSSNSAAWLTAAKAKPLVVKEAPYTSPGPDEVLIKNGAMAVNPVDWKVQEYGIFLQKYPNVLGSDVAGEVVDVGSNVTNFKKGQRVMAHCITLMTNEPKSGGFQHYTAAPSALMCQIPDSLPYEQACVLPLAIDTASAGLFQKDALALPHPSLSPKPNGATLLVWGGSSSVGSCVIQLAVAAGVEVVTTASKRNFDYCKKLGASQVFDHSSSSVVDEITSALKGKKMAGAYDAVSEKDTKASVAKILKQCEGTQKIVLVLPCPEDEIDGIPLSKVFAISVMKNEVGPLIWGDFLPKALEQGTIQAKPDPLIIGEGLESVQKGFDKAKEGVSAQKVVIKL